MNLYVLLPIISIFIVAMASQNEFLSTPYIIKMGIALLLLFISITFIVRDKRKFIKEKRDSSSHLKS